MNTRFPVMFSWLALLALLLSACGDTALTPTPTPQSSPPTQVIAEPTQPDEAIERAGPTVEATLIAETTPSRTSPSDDVPTASLSVIPNIDATMKTRLRAILADGKSKGNRPEVFAKIGDSITESGSFLQGIGCRDEALGDYGSLAATIEYFRATKFPAGYASTWCDEANSFNRGSASAVAGWSADQALQPLDPPNPACPAPYATALACELHLLKPGIALIMYGTNDLQRYGDPQNYRANLTRIVKEVIANGTIPILSTIPPRIDDTSLVESVETHNRVVAVVAEENGIPVWNYWLALQAPGMVNGGMDQDGIHPNVYKCPPCEADDFTAEGLRYGYNVRNLTAIQVLDKLRRVVLEDGPPDGASGSSLPLATATTPPVGDNQPASSRNGASAL